MKYNKYKLLKALFLCFVFFVGTLNLSLGNAHAATQRQVSSFLNGYQQGYAGTISATTGNYITSIDLQWGLTSNSGGAGSICNCSDGYNYYGNWNFYITNDQGQIVWQNNNPNFNGGTTSSTATIPLQVDANFAPTTSLNFYWGYQMWMQYFSNPPYVVTRYLLRNNSSSYYPNAGVATLTEADTTTVQTLNSAQAAANNASAANTAAQAAQTASNNALNGTNTIINNYLSTSAGVVQDTSGNTVLSVAKAAKSSADTASQNALLSNNQTIYTGGGADNNKSAAQLSKEGKDLSQQAVTGITNAQTQLSDKLDTLQSNFNNSITNIQNFMAPPLNRISGYLNTTVTSGSSINLTLDYSQANEYQYRIDNGSWSSWTSLASHDANGYLTVPGLTSGFHTIYIQIRYNNGTVVSPAAKGSITVQKL